MKYNSQFYDNFYLQCFTVLPQANQGGCFPFLFLRAVGLTLLVYWFIYLFIFSGALVKYN